MALTPTPVSLIGGINMLQDPLAVADDELLLAKNIFPRKPGLASLRPSMQNLQRALPMPRACSDNFAQVRDLFLTNNLGAGIILCVTGGNDQGQGVHYGNAYDLPDVGARLLLIKSIGDVLAGSSGELFRQTLGDIPDRPCVFDHGDYVIALDGLNPGFYYERLGPDGMTGITWAGTPPTSFKPKLAAELANRVVYAQDNFLVWSDINEPFTVGGSWPLPDNDPITAIDKVSTSGVSQAQSDCLLVRTLNSAYLVTGAPDESSGPLPGALEAVPSIAKLPVAAGCVSQATAVTTPYGHIWCGLDDVWLLQGGAIPQRIGSKIRPAIERLVSGLEWTAHACFADGVYRLALPSAAQEQGADEPLQEQYWLDFRGLKDNMQAGGLKWFGPQVFIPEAVWDGEDRQGTTNLRLDTRVGNQQQAVSAIAARSLKHLSASVFSYPTTIMLVKFDGDENVDCVYPRKAVHEDNRVPSADYEVGDLVSWDDLDWECVTAGTADSTTAAAEFTGPGAGGSWVGQGTPAGYTIADNTVNWQPQMVVPDGVDGSNFPTRSPCPSFISNTRAQNAAYTFEILTKEYTAPDVILDRRVDSAEISSASGTPTNAYYQFLPMFQNMTYPGIAKTLRESRNISAQLDATNLPLSADARRLVKNHLPASPTARRASQHHQMRLLNQNSLWTGGPAGVPDPSYSFMMLYVVAQIGMDQYVSKHQFPLAQGWNGSAVIIAEFMNQVSSVVNALTNAELTGGAVPDSNPVCTFTWSDVDQYNPILRFTLEVAVPSTPYDRVWVFLNNFGATYPNGDVVPETLTANEQLSRQFGSSLFGGVVDLERTGIDGIGNYTGEDTVIVSSPYGVWGFTPQVPELAGLTMFTKVYGRRDNDGLAQVPDNTSFS